MQPIRWSRCHLRYHSDVSKEIATLYRADQAERCPHPAHGTPAYRALRERDAARRARVREILRGKKALTRLSRYRAAMILQHGDEIEDIALAHTLARAAADAGYAPARWLAAASLDRWLMYQGKPQKYGTNIVPDGKRQRVWDVDPATTDIERAEWDVPPLAEMQRRAEALTRGEPIPTMQDAPDWLKEAVRRWYPVGR